MPRENHSGLSSNDICNGAAIPFDVEDAGSPVPSVFGEVCRHGSLFLTVGKCVCVCDQNTGILYI